MAQAKKPAKAVRKPAKATKKAATRASTKKAAKKASGKATAAKKAPARKASAKEAGEQVERRYGRRADYGGDVDSLVAKLPPSTQEIVRTLRDIVLKAAPEATESIKWGVPVYGQNGLFCYISPKGSRVRFGFYEQGVRLTDPDGLLEGSGKNMRHVKIDSAQDIRPELFTRWVQEAVQVNVSR